MKHSKTSKRWLKEHFNDSYVKRAQEEGYPSRAAYKLLEIQKKDQLIKPRMRIVDLGAAPGGWSMVAGKLVGKKGKVYALDILPMEPITNVTFIQGDFTEETVFDELMSQLNGNRVDCVLSDMAPNLSGTKAIDQPRAMHLAELAFEFAKQTLKPAGNFIVKVFQGEGFDPYLKMLRQSFAKVVSRKPQASRSRSNEVYLVAKGIHL